jgi:hypothetical protein
MTNCILTFPGDAVLLLERWRIPVVGHESGS